MWQRVLVSPGEICVCEGERERTERELLVGRERENRVSAAEICVAESCLYHRSLQQRYVWQRAACIINYVCVREREKKESCWYQLERYVWQRAAGISKRCVCVCVSVFVRKEGELLIYFSFPSSSLLLYI